MDLTRRWPSVTAVLEQTDELLHRVQEGIAELRGRMAAMHARHAGK